MTTMASQITSLMVVYWTVYSDADQRKHQSSASLASVWGIHRDRWIPRTKDHLRGKCFHLMTSSCDDGSCCIRVIICRLFFVKPLPKPLLTGSQPEHYGKLQYSYMFSESIVLYWTYQKIYKFSQGQMNRWKNYKRHNAHKSFFNSLRFQPH